MSSPGRVRVLGLLCIVCGLLVSLAGTILESQAARSVGAKTADTVTARFSNGLFGVAVLGLMAGVVGLRALGVGGSGWLPRMATWLTLIGLLLYVIGGLSLTTDASADSAMIPAGGTISSVGMIMLGIAAIRAKVPNDWRRFVPLLVGVWFFAQLPLQIIFFIRVAGDPSFLILLGVLGVLWALVGYVVLSLAAEHTALKPA